MPISQRDASRLVESLRKGIPPQYGVSEYTVGHGKLIEGIRNYHLAEIGSRGIIRFVSGSWGSGKTHFFRLLREVAFLSGCLVSNVELNVNDAPLNKFERVFYSIVRNISMPSAPGNDQEDENIVPFGRVVRRALAFLSSTSQGQVTYEDYAKAKTLLMGCSGIDIDFKKMIDKSWETYLPESGDSAFLDQTREEILQWFGGEGSIGAFRKRFNVNKMVSKDNARLMLQSLAAFIKLSGYAGLVILFDEAEQAYSLMRRADLRNAHNNLLSLINGVDAVPGLFLIYATTPDFYTDPKHGISVYGALVSRIGQPEKKAPRALDVVWNMDSVNFDLPMYQEAAQKIASIYLVAYPGFELPAPQETDGLVRDLYQIHPSMSAMRFWRVMVTGLVSHFDDVQEGESVRQVDKLYDDVMAKLREE